MSLPWFVFGAAAHGGSSRRCVFMAWSLVFAGAAVVVESDSIAMAPAVPALFQWISSPIFASFGGGCWLVGQVQAASR